MEHLYVLFEMVCCCFFINFCFFVDFYFPSLLLFLFHSKVKVSVVAVLDEGGLKGMICRQRLLDGIKGAKED